MDLQTTQGQQGQFRSLKEVPLKYRRIFSSYPCFNSVQSQVLDHVFHSNNSVVVAAPTGSGKTVVFELAVIKLLIDLEEKGFKNDFKIIYVCPVKALCRERFDDWNPRFSQVGISCIEVTGDGGDYFDLQGFNIIITTPEKWDSLTRKWRDNASLVQLVKLFMIDEVHLLSDNKRGPVLEAIVCRMKTVAKTLRQQPMRFVAVSATIYNVEDLASWLGNEDEPAHWYKFGSESRPVLLNKIVKGYRFTEQQKDFLFDIQLSYKLKPLILEHAKGKPTLIFCSTRKSVAQTSKILSGQLTFHFSETQRKNLNEGAHTIRENKLRELILCGIGYHHAGLAVEDRHLIQNLFVSGSLPILVATSTLAMGVNLPAHLVIIKSTQQFIAGKVEEYSESAVLQMIGRAGRPQFDVSATAIIMTKENLVPKYERLLESKEIVESSLHLHLAEHLNSEIVLYTITDLSVAMEWIRCTFLYVRAMRDPKHYGFDASSSKLKIEKNLETICLREINALKKADLINIDGNGLDISPTSNGRLMSHFYLSFETFKIFLQITGTESVPEILTALCEAHEFEEVQLRVNERKTLNELNKNSHRETIRYPLAGKVKNKAMKINCLIQSCLGSLPIQDPGLQQESVRVVRIAERLAKCLSEFLSKKQHHQSLLSAAILAKCLHARLWQNSPFLCRQLDRIGATLGALLAACGKTTFCSIEHANPRDLERILNRAPPLGNLLQNAVRHLPKYDLKIETVKMDAMSFKTNVCVTLTNADIISERNTAGDRHGFSLIVGDSNNNLLSYNYVLDRFLINKPFQVTIISKHPDLPHKITADVICDQWIGIDVNAETVLVPSLATPKPKIASPPPKKRKKTATEKQVDFMKAFCNKTDAEKVLESRIKCNDFIESKIVQRVGKSVERPPKASVLVSCFDIDIEIVETKNTEQTNAKLTEPAMAVKGSEFLQLDAQPPQSRKAVKPLVEPELKPSRSFSSSLQTFYESLKKSRQGSFNFFNSAETGCAEFNPDDSDRSPFFF